MTAIKTLPPVSVPMTFKYGLMLVAAFMAFVAWDQSHWWRLKEDYSFGWLVPMFVAYVIYERWPRVLSRLRAVEQGIAPTPEATWLQPLVPWIAGLAMAFGIAFFFLGAMYRAAAGSSYNGTFALSCGMALMALTFIYFTAPTRDVSVAGRRADRWQMAQLFVFPALVWLVSAPMLAIVENNLNVFLMRQVTTVVFFVFDTLGLPLEQRGNVLVLPTGNVGVAEACSGIRSLTGCLFSGTFIAAVWLESRWAKFTLVTASLLFAFAANLVRSVFLTTWAYNHGASSIEGTIHDVSGYAVLGLTVVALLCCMPFLSPKKPKAELAASDIAAVPLVAPRA